jgi:carbon monoxide dehydrogenase subunit G
MFRIKASYTGQLELKTTLERAREFFGELTNFADLMPGIEGIRKESSGIVRWLVRAEVPVIGSVQASFAVRKTEDRPERLEWSPAGSEMKNYLRYAAAFEMRGHNVLIKISQHVELRRPHARDLHTLAAFIGEGAISSELQKRITEMIKTFLERAQDKLEGESALEQEAIS